MDTLKIGDIVARKSYGGDVYFRITDIDEKSSGKKVYVLKGLLYRIEADSDEEDLVLQNADKVHRDMQRSVDTASLNRITRGSQGYFRLFNRFRGTSGRILHIDSSSEYLDMCMKFYRKSGLRATGKVLPESEQPSMIGDWLASSKADILIITGHDGLKKNATNLKSLDSYRNSRYYIQSVREARKYESNQDNLCIFAGACQSYYEGIMNAGANFASSPGRILIHALDPGKVGDRVALTDSRKMVTPEKIAELTESGMKGIGGIRTKGHYLV